MQTKPVRKDNLKVGKIYYRDGKPRVILALGEDKVFYKYYDGVIWYENEWIEV